MLLELYFYFYPLIGQTKRIIGFSDLNTQKFSALAVNAESEADSVEIALFSLLISQLDSFLKEINVVKRFIPIYSLKISVEDIQVLQIKTLVTFSLIKVGT